MRPFLLHILLLLALCFALSNCKHEPVIDPNGPQCGEATTIDEMMEWVYFKTGTYWIYEEQNTGALDTMTVYYDYNGVSPTGNRDFVVKMRSSLDGYTYEYWFNDAWSGDCSLFPGCFCRVVDCEKYIPGDYAGGNHCLIFPLKVGSQVSQHGGDLNFGLSKIVDRLDLLEIEGNLFLNLYEFRQDYSAQHLYVQSNYWLCKNIGFVRKKIMALEQDWFLYEFEIIQ